MADDLLDHPLIGGRYFFPLPGELETPFWVDCGDARLACSYHETDPAARTLIHFHGNGDIVDDYLGPFVARILAMGCNCLLAEYRGYGRSTGQPRLGRMLADVVRTVAALGQREDRLIFFGRSVGSIFAVEAVRRFPRAAGLILESGVADALERLLLRVTPRELGVDAAELERTVARHLNQRGKLENYRGALLVMHCEGDDLVDVSHGRRLCAWGGGRKRLHLFPCGDHNSILAVNFEEYFELVEEFVASLPE
jgi:Serine aminopeptidase, S33